ncbi:MAG: sigma-54-dependent Fis family transcriptional regulator [Wenzhouxiangella sp.]|nr:MAG: sigma-54-dependent Fis family transcriptional regulator [Wenzhouxiangella sp.]
MVAVPCYAPKRDGMSPKAKTETRILVADDQADVRHALKLALERAGYAVELAADPAAAEKAVHAGVDLALLDMNYSRDTTSGREGLALIKKARELDPDLPLVVMTAWGSVELAVAALKAGASDFIEKPWDNSRLLNIVRTQLEAIRARSETRRYRDIARIQRRDQGSSALIGESEAMRRVLDTCARVAGSDASVLITGENGVGKGLLADFLHRQSNRADGPFVSVNLGAIPESLFESEMFGHVRGAFTDASENRSGRFALADGGTLFLDEIGNLPEAHQAKLLRVLESGQFEAIGANKTQTVDVRVVTATNARLPEKVAHGSFRRDLFYRINTIEIEIPPLRDRGDDVLLLAEHFLGRFAHRHGRRLVFSEPSAKALKTHSWPGNVRELSHAVERAVLLCSEGHIEPEHLRLASFDHAGGLDFNRILPLEEAEALLIRNALDRFDGNAEQAAVALGISRSAMYRRMEKFGIR